MYKIPEIIIETSRKLRKEMTEAEKFLWKYIRWEKLWVKFLRQHPVYVFTEDSWMHRYIIADFYNHNRKIIIEIDWDIHWIDTIYLLDREKETLLQNLWYTVIRFSNNEIFCNQEECLNQIKNLLL